MAGDEVINYIAGAEAKEQGVCNRTWGGQRPHCCLKNPVIIDLNPGAPYNKQVANCCKGGVLSSLIQDPSTAAASFQMNVGLGGNGNVSNLMLPGKFRFGSPGYSCGNPEIIDQPTKFPEDRGRRWTQALKTWKVICTFSQFQASPTPTCCVSLSAFYSPTIIKCQTCSCGCCEPSQSKCLKAGEMPSALLQPKDKDPDAEPPLVVMCSIHMCPIQVHWHVKQSYKEYWRLKITITNLNAYKNYSQWNLAVKHPNLQSIAEVFSFNYRPLNISGPFNDTGLFWGIQKYNDMLLQMGENGFVQTELILHKDLGQFTFNSGWAFPRRIYFDGQECVMPPPDEFPSLPKERIKAYK
ncbi:hypothetical protein Nepgr_026214 [Nepenthes gracilis]|uniref:COBRA C-terminal domain-containing protein n=1 Tax=Nepenthes gracilis TaxID=150966 RepID=A0AAD3T878_NEPGR|nr:hypothetical protein Nepgr_026214 [Nepenthes gracilis]